MLERGYEFAPGYRLQEFLGRGQFGQVWRASAPGGTAAAVKFIDLTEGSGQKEYDGVKRVKQIRQANLMPITAIWLLDKDGKVIDEPPDDATQTMDIGAPGVDHSGMLVMPQEEPAWLVVSMLLGGKSLLQRLMECNKKGMPGIPPKELLSYMEESAKGLDFLNEPRHDLGEGPVAIQHCDVKPANIVMIGTSAVVCDFGLARILSRNQVTATSASGTPAYMAPEAIGGKPSRTSDQYSLAVTYYHLRTGSLPIKDGTLYEVLDAHRQGKLDFAAVGNAEQEVLRKATDLDWEKRFESNVDFVDALREALRSEGFTRPSFVPKTSAADHDRLRLTGETETLDNTGQDTNSDPTATIDTGVSRPDEVETIDLVGKSPEGKKTATPAWLQPRYIAAAAMALVAIGVVASLPFGTRNGSNRSVPAQSDNNGDSDVQPELSPDDLMASAVAAFDSDEASALKYFSEARKLDPGLAEVTSLVMGSHSDAVERLVQSADGAHLVSIGYDNQPFVWDISALSPELTPLKLTAGNYIYPDGIAISPDGTKLLCGSGVNGYVWTLDREPVDDSRIELPPHEDEISSVAWHAVDPRFVATSSENGQIGITELGPPTTEKPAGSVTRSKMIDVIRPGKSVSFDPDGNFLVVVTQEGTVEAFPWQEIVAQLGDTSSPDAIPVTAEGSRAVGIDFVRSLDDQTLVAVGSSDGSITLWELGGEIKQRDRFAAHDKTPVEALKVARDGKRCVVAAGGSDGNISAWPVSRPDQQKKHPVSSVAVAAIDISEDGRWIAAGCNDGMVWLWDHAADKLASFPTGTETVDSICIDSGGKWLIAGCSDGSIRAWDLVHCKLVALTVLVLKAKLQPEKREAMQEA